MQNFNSQSIQILDIYRVFLHCGISAFTEISEYLFQRCNKLTVITVMNTFLLRLKSAKLQIVAFF